MTTVSTARFERTFERAVTAAIVFNSGLLAWGLVDEGHEHLIEALDLAVVWFFVAETGFRIKTRVRAVGWRNLHRDRLLIFDAALIGLALAPVGVNLTTLRIVKAARVFHFGRHISGLRHFVNLRFVTRLGRWIAGRQQMNIAKVVAAVVAVAALVLVAPAAHAGSLYCWTGGDWALCGETLPTEDPPIQGGYLETTQSPSAPK